MKDIVFGGRVIALDRNAESEEAVEFVYQQHACALYVSPRSGSEGGVWQGCDCTSLEAPSTTTVSCYFCLILLSEHLTDAAKPLLFSSTVLVSRFQQS